MIFTKLLRRILDNQKEIKAMLDPSVLEKAKKYDELSARMKSVKLKVKNISRSIDEQGVDQVVVNYAPLSESIKIYDNGQVVSSDCFKAINFMNLVSLEDMTKISKVIESAKKLNKY